MNRNLLTIEPSILSLANIMRDINPEIERPAIDDSRMVLETEKTFLATLDMPGVNMADISIEIEDNKLTITAERRHPFQEQNKIFKKYNYTYTLPKTVDQENINATMDNGVLCLTLPKMDEAKYKKKIQVTNSQKSSLWSNFLNFRKAEHEKEKDVINAQ